MAAALMDVFPATHAVGLPCAEYLGILVDWNR
jgi:hypothetical protein